MKYPALIFITVLILSGIIVFQDGFRNYFTHEILSSYIIYFTFANDFNIPECFYSNAFGYFPEYFPLQGGVFRPLLTCSLALEYLIYGLNPFGYHVINYLVHVLNALLVYLLANYFLKKPALSMICSSFFFFHPWNSSPLIILIQRSGIVHTSFYLSAILFFIKYRESDTNPKLWLSAVIICSLGAWCIYEMFISLPFVLLSLDLLYFQKRKKPGRWYWIHIGMLYGLILTLNYRYIVFRSFGGYSGTTPKSSHLVLSFDILTNYYNYITGFLGMYLPAHSAVIILLLTAVFIGALFLKNRCLGFLTAWVFLTPVPIITMGLNPYYFYLPSVGLILIFVSIFGRMVINISGLKTAGYVWGVFLYLILILHAGIIRDEFHQIYTDNLDAHEMVEQIHEKYPLLPDHSRIYMVIPRLTGRDEFGRNYFDISLEHLVQLRYHKRTIRCFPLPVTDFHPKYSHPDIDKNREKTLFIQRVENEFIEYDNLADVKKNMEPVYLLKQPL